MYIFQQIKEEAISPKNIAEKEKAKNMKDYKNSYFKLLPRKKRCPEMVKSYDWTPQLKTPGFCAAPVSCFKHVSFVIYFIIIQIIQHFIKYKLIIFWLNM